MASLLLIHLRQKLNAKTSMILPNNLLKLDRKARRYRMTDTIMETPTQTTHSDDKITYTRFDISQRVEHILFLLSFSILGFTGLIQKFSAYPLSDYFIFALGGIERVRII